MSERSHWDLADIDGRPRFYPPGQHPATYRSREALLRAEEFERQYGPSPAVTATIDYLRELIVAFEERESEIKAVFERQLRKD